MKHITPTKSEYKLNDSYNKKWINQYGLKYYQNIMVEDFVDSPLSKKYAKNFVLSWLINIDKMINLSTKMGMNLEEFHFLDIGCGTGISTIYASSRNNFRLNSGLDFQSSFIKMSKENLEIFNQNQNLDIKFFLDDASSIKLNKEKYFLFMLDPFQREVMSNFLDNNITNLKETQSCLAYTNCHCIETITDYNPRKVHYLEKTNSAFIEF
jgi:SAM-dependent methyltransferase